MDKKEDNDNELLKNSVEEKLKQLEKEEEDDDLENDEVYKRHRERKRNKKHHSKFYKIVRALLIILLVILIIVGIIAFIAFKYIDGMVSQVNVETIDTNEIGIVQATEQQLKGYRNIALLGIDSRQDDYGLGNRSDCIIIASINQDTNDVKLISVYRDTYMKVKESGAEVLDKVTHAYSYGGAQNTLYSLNKNLDLNIKEYVTVNFDAVVKAVDALDGVEIKIEDDELEYINSYIRGTSNSTGVTSNSITHSGKQTLDGVQAVAYSRIRYTEGGDYKRTERMRTVIEAMIKKAKTLPINKLIEVANTIIPSISTNIDKGEITSLLPSLIKVNLSRSIGWPYNTKGITMDRWYGIPVTLESNVTQLHQEIFEETNYVLPDTIKQISDEIVAKTGYTE